MPTYQYRCKDCGHELEVVQKFTDDALTECSACVGGELRKVFNAVGVVFKGSGFYRTDSRTASSSSGSSDGGGSSTKSDAKPASTSESKSASTPAPAAVGSGN